MFLAFVKKRLSSIPLGDLEGFDLIIFENLDKSLEFVCDEMPIQQLRTYARNLFLLFFFIITMSVLPFYLFNRVKTCDRIRLRLPTVLLAVE